VIRLAASDFVVTRDGDPRFCPGASPHYLRPERGPHALQVGPRYSALVLLIASITLGTSARLAAAPLPQSINATDDVLLSAMQAELDRSKSQIKMQGADPPYFLEYRVADVHEYEAHANFGALVRESRLHLRFVRAVVRVGDYKEDSYYGQGQGVADYIGIDDDMLALRHQLWLLTDQAYKNAIEALAAKRAALKQYKIDRPIGCRCAIVAPRADRRHVVIPH
jgi:hypothetical protein